MEDNDRSTVSGSIDIRVQWITPELAKHWLGNFNNVNRQKKKAGIEFLAAEIAEGRHILTHQGIAFGADGELYDGQHRLEAIVLAGVPVQMMVTRGLSPQARDVIDSGSGGGVRSPNDILKMTDDVTVSAALRAWVANAEMLLEHGRLTGTQTRMSAHALRVGLARHRMSIDAMKESLGERTARISLSPVCAAFVICHRVMGAPVVEMARKMVSGEGLSAGNPALTIRNHLLQYNHSSPQGREDINCRVFGAIDAYVRGADLKISKLNEGAREKIISSWKKLEAKGASK